MQTESRRERFQTTRSPKLKIQDCPVCGRGLYVNARLVGDFVTCPQCRAVLQAEEFYHWQHIHADSNTSLMDRVNAVLDALARRQQSELSW